MTRLLDMGIEDYLADRYDPGVLAQRLVRQLWLVPAPFEAPRGFGRALAGHASNCRRTTVLYGRLACPVCDGIGFRGREDDFPNCSW